MGSIPVMVRVPEASEPEPALHWRRVTMLLEVDKDHLSVLRRALEARVRDMHLRLGSEPGDEGFRREVMLSTQLLRQVEALERRSGRRAWNIGDVESLPEDET